MSKDHAHSLLPPKWMVKEAAQDAIRRRLVYAPSARVAQLTDAEPEKVRQYLEWNSDYAALALHPPSETMHVERRISQYGQGFPGLFNIDGISRAHDVRRGADEKPVYSGAVHVKNPGPILLLAEDRFKVVMRTNCFLRIEPDSSIVLSGLSMRSCRPSKRKFSYRINFVYIVAFGRTISPFRFVEEFERVLVYYFGMDADNAPTKKIRGSEYDKGAREGRLEEVFS